MQLHSERLVCSQEEAGLSYRTFGRIVVRGLYPESITMATQK